jgi:hypothetical protein
MITETVVVSILWYAGLIAALVLIPKMKLREAVVGFLACQPLTWTFSFIELRTNLLTFPVREFPLATSINFTTEFWAYPLLCALFVIYKDRFPRWRKYVFLGAIITILTTVDVLIESYTDLIEYHRHTWFSVWVSFYVIFLLADLFHQWFYSGTVASEKGVDSA